MLRVLKEEKQILNTLPEGVERTLAGGGVRSTEPLQSDD